MSNLAFAYDDSIDCYDIFVENGHLAKSDGLDSQLLMSVLNNSRASDSEQPIKNLQNGWAGNSIVNSAFPNYETGCKQWLYNSQAKTTTETSENIMETIKTDGLQWMIDDNLINDVEVSINEIDYSEGTLSLDFNLKIDENNIETKKIILWNNTELN